MAALTRRNPFTGEAGSELVEFALVLPILLLVVGGILDFGLLFQKYEVVTNAAREGARMAILGKYTEADVQARVQSYLTAGRLNSANIQSITCLGCFPQAPQVVPVTPAPPGTPFSFNAVKVTVTYNYPYTILGPVARLVGGGFGTTALTATSVMRSEL